MASVQSTTGSRGLRISGSNATYTMFRGSVKSTGYPLHSPVSPSLPLPASPLPSRFKWTLPLIMLAQTFQNIPLTTVQDAVPYTSGIVAGTLVLLNQPFVMLSQTFLTANSMASWTFACVRLKRVSPTFRVNLVSLILWLEN